MDEQSLINSLRDGDERAFNLIFRQFHSPIYKWVYHAMNDGDAAQDITQDIFLWLWEKREALPAILNLKAYLVASARHRVYQLVRQQQRMEQMTIALMEDGGKHQHADPVDKERPIDEVLKAMNSLPPAKKRILHLFYLQGNTAKHISKKMGVNYQYVRNALSLGRSEIRVRLIGRRKI